jgi:hypothetical protein
MLPRRNPAIGPNALEIGEGSVHPEPVDIPIDEAILPGSQVMDAIGQLCNTPIKITFLFEETTRTFNKSL